MVAIVSMYWLKRGQFIILYSGSGGLAFANTRALLESFLVYSKLYQ